MSTENLAFLREKDFNKLAPLVKNMDAWRALLTLLEHEEAKLVLGLMGRPHPDELVRISAKYEFIQHLKKAQERVLDIERGLK